MSWYNSSANNFVISWADSPSEKAYSNTSVSKISNIETETTPKAPKQRKETLAREVNRPKKRKTDPEICTSKQKKKKKITKNNFF